MRLSACIITFNEADRIEDCLRSLSFCDEILVVDSHSTDATAGIAAALGARVIERDFRGYRDQKEYAVRAATHDWVLSVDADERVTPPLRAAIERERAAAFEGRAGYRMNRATEYFGRFLRHGNAYPDAHLRLFDRRCGEFLGYEVHEHIAVRGRIGHLAGDLEHCAYRSLTDQQQRLRRYATLMSESMQTAGRRSSIGRIIFNPLWRFLRGYVLRAGFLDGWRGFVYAWTESVYVRDKYVRLYLLQRGFKA